MKKVKLFIVLLVGFLSGYGLANFSKLNKFSFLTNVQPSLVSQVSQPPMLGIPPPTEKKSQLQQMVSRVLPELQVEELSLSPVSSIYQVIANGEVFYASQDGRYLLHGDLLDLTRKLDNLSQTEDVRKTLRLKALEAASKKEMIIFKPKVVKGVVTVFTDVDCIFCQRFHKEINKIMELGIEVRYLAFPRQGIDSDSYKKTVSIWCADNAKAMLTAAKNGEAVPNKICDAPVANHYKLGRKLNLHGTPTLLFPDGSMFARFMVPEELAKFALEHQAGVK